MPRASIWPTRSLACLRLSTIDLQSLESSAEVTKMQMRPASLRINATATMWARQQAPFRELKESVTCTKISAADQTRIESWLTKEHLYKLASSISSVRMNPMKNLISSKLAGQRMLPENLGAIIQIWINLRNILFLVCKSNLISSKSTISMILKL